MPVSKSCRLLVLALVVGGCGSEVEARSDWVLGTFSDHYVNDTTISGLNRYHFREDGTLAETRNQEELLQEYKWSRAGEWLVIVDVPEDSIHDEWRVVPGETCNFVDVNPIQYGKVAGSFTLSRGAVCMKELPPCQYGLQCETCETDWCDEPPPPCGGD